MLNLKYDQPYFMQIPCFPNILEFLCYAVHYFPQFIERLTTGILNVALGWTFQFFPW